MSLFRNDAIRFMLVACIGILWSVVEAKRKANYKRLRWVIPFAVGIIFCAVGLLFYHSSNEFFENVIIVFSECAGVSVIFYGVVTMLAHRRATDDGAQDDYSLQTAWNRWLRSLPKPKPIYTPQMFLAKSDDHEIIFHSPWRFKWILIFCFFLFGAALLWTAWCSIPPPFARQHTAGFYVKDPVTTILIYLLFYGGLMWLFYTLALLRQLCLDLLSQSYTLKIGFTSGADVLTGPFSDIAYLYVQPDAVSYRHIYRMGIKWKIKRRDYLLGISEERIEAELLTKEYAEKLNAPFWGVIAPTWRQ
jgi:hypothetical protein